MSKISEPREEDRAEERKESGSGISRRSFLQSMGFAAGAAAVPLHLRSAEAQSEGGAGLGPGAFKLKLKINGEVHTVDAEPRMTLAQVLRDKLDMTGTKVVCDRGACGGCTVMIDGESVNSCMLLAVDARDKNVTTIEGLAKDGKLDPVQEGFVEHDALQCGFCTPGFIMRSRALLNETPHPTLEEIKKGLAGNICRCGTYTNIFGAVMAASKKGA